VEEAETAAEAVARLEAKAKALGIENPDVLPPCDDGVFKTILTHRNSDFLRADFLSSITLLKVASSKVVQNELYLEHINEKRQRFEMNCDFVVEAEIRLDETGKNEKRAGAARGGTQSDTEIQLKAMDGDSLEHGHVNLLSRATYSLARLHGHQDAKQMDYHKLKRTFVIFIYNFTVFVNEDFANYFMLVNKKTGEICNEDMTLIFIELTKLDESLEKPVEEMDAAEQWAIFFKYAKHPDKKIWS
jgi:hypothetical protein